MVEERIGEPPATEQSTRVRLDLAYDGTDFVGWSRQPGLRTVQGELNAALDTIFTRHGPTPQLTVAGRTDAGVHALGQVAHLDLTAAQVTSLERPRRGGSGRKLDGLSTLGRRLNGIAGYDEDLRVRRAIRAPDGFDARFSGIWRRYEYRVSDGNGPRNPLERRNTLWYPRSLNVNDMNAAADTLLGLHDWAAYCKASDVGSTIRTLQEFRWTREPHGVISARVVADAFCHNMVRALVGATVAVGSGSLGIDELRTIRDGLRRTDRFTVVAAKGLTLMEIGYPPDAQLAARAEQTRAVRPPIAGSGAVDGLPAQLTRPVDLD